MIHEEVTLSTYDQCTVHPFDHKPLMGAEMECVFKKCCKKYKKKGHHCKKCPKL